MLHMEDPTQKVEVAVFGSLLSEIRKKELIHYMIFKIQFIMFILRLSSIMAMLNNHTVTQFCRKILSSNYHLLSCHKDIHKLYLIIGYKIKFNLSFLLLSYYIHSWRS